MNQTREIIQLEKRVSELEKIIADLLQTHPDVMAKTRIRLAKDQIGV